MPNLAGLHCLRCGYSLTALTEPRCPECGEAFDPRLATLPAMPWERRAELGYWRAVLGTHYQIWLSRAARRQWMLRPVGLAAAKRYWWGSMAVWLILLLAAVIWCVLWALPDDTWLTRAMCVLTLWSGGAAGLAAYATFPTYFLLHRRAPREMQDRAVAIWLYHGTAAIAWPLFAGGCVAAARYLNEILRILVPPPGVIWLAFGLLAAIGLVAPWWRLAKLRQQAAALRYPAVPMALLAWVSSSLVAAFCAVLVAVTVALPWLMWATLS